MWRLAVADVTPIAGRPAAEAETAGAAAEALADARVPVADGAARSPQLPRLGNAGARVGSRPAAAPSPVELVPGTASGIDKRTLARLRRGLIAPDSRVDLHNHTQEQAHRLLDAVLASSQMAGRRCVLVITGKGYGPGGAVGVLKTMVPRWLNEQPNRSRVLAFCHAPAAQGGEGALYVLLRRPKPATPR